MAEVDQKTPERQAALLHNKIHAINVGNLLVTLMMICVSAAFIQLGQRLSPTWSGAYLVFLAIFLSIESVYTHNLVREWDTRERWTFRISEWVAFAVGIKILLYMVHGFDQLLTDVRTWQTDFLSFFTPEYMVALFLAAIVWFSSQAYASDFEQLFNREEDDAWDDLGKLQNALHVIRGRIIQRAFIIGALIVFIAILVRIDSTQLLRAFGTPPAEGYNAPIINVAFYFLLAMILLSQTQLALLQTRWTWQKLIPSPQIAGNWLRYSLIFFVVLSVIAVLLPTEYSFGLFSTLGIVIDVLFQAAAYIFFLIMLPFQLLGNLFRPAGELVTPFSPPPPIIRAEPPGAAPQIPNAWWEFVKSLLYWGVFLGVIIFAVFYYLRSNTHLWNAITGFPLLRWLGNAWRGLRNWIRRGVKGVRSVVTNAVQRIRVRAPRIDAAALRRFFDPRKLTPREKVIYYYQNLIEEGSERGLDRRPSQTPYQYQQRLDTQVPEVQDELHDLTGAFMEARYTQHNVDSSIADRAGSLWERIKNVLRSWNKSN